MPKNLVVVFAILLFAGVGVWLFGLSSTLPGEVRPQDVAIEEVGETGEELQLAPEIAVDEAVDQALDEPERTALVDEAIARTEHAFEVYTGRRGYMVDVYAIGTDESVPQAEVMQIDSNDKHLRDLFDTIGER